MFKKVRALILGVPLIIATLSAVTFSGVALAAGADSWTGTDCGGGTPDCNWNDASNWSAGIPASGDDLTFDNSILSAGVGDPIDNMSGLSINSINFINNGSTITNEIDMTSPLTIVSAITQAPSSSTTTDIIGGLSAGVGAGSETITLGGNVTVTSVGGLDLGQDSTSFTDQIALASFTLDFVSTTSTSNAVEIAASITGAGTVTYNSASTDYITAANNTYSGVTNVDKQNDFVGDLLVSGLSQFGTSTVNISSSGAVVFADDSSTSITNPIVIAGVSSGSPITSLDFACASSCASNTVVSVPNITLNGETRFGNVDDVNNLSVNLTGIHANSNCVQYITTSGTTSPGFTGGPSACIVVSSGSGGSSSTSAPAKAAPKAPNTGFGLVSSHPAASLIGTTLMAGGLYMVPKRLRKATSKR